MVGIRVLKKVNTIEDLENLNIGKLVYEINYRGGSLGFTGNAVADFFNINSNDLPPKFGAYVNYLGGGVRGSINISNFNTNISKRKKQLLNELGAACKRVYLNEENQLGLNSSGDDDINWDAKATQAARNAGIISAY